MLTARDIMTAPVETVAPDDDVSEVLTLLAEADFSGFPVVENGTLVGIVARQDVLRAVRDERRGAKTER